MKYEEVLKELEEGLRICISELVQIQRRKAWFEQAIAGIKGITGNEEADPEVAGITQAIRDLLYEHPNRWVSAPAVRDKLKEIGFPIDGYTQPLAVVHTTLKRLVRQEEFESGHIEGASRYRWACKERERK